MSFTTDLITKRDMTQNFSRILVEPLVYENQDYIITVYPNFDYDGASIPWLFRRVLPREGMSYDRAACCNHDYDVTHTYSLITPAKNFWYSLGNAGVSVGWVDGTYYFEELVDGTVGYRPNYTIHIPTEQEIMMKLVQHFTEVATAYIEGKVKAYNDTHGLAFKDIDAFTKYAINPLSQHYAIANQFITYASNIWAKARTYQGEILALGVAPTEAEFKAQLDAVVF